ncbi:biotin/lipoyl attachment domain-containing protein [Euphorbia peplus]|nr:biotin/lipoyl attachment domain-containing protein [Euphorbia peplus]
MESSIALHSFHCKTYGQSLTLGPRSICGPVRRNVSLVACVKAPAADTTVKSSGDGSVGALEKSGRSTAAFPNGFEALVLEVCDETEIAELKVKVGDFEMHLRRNVGATKVPLSNISPVEPPPIPTKPMDVSAPVSASPSPPKSFSEKSAPFMNHTFAKPSKLVALEASGASGYVLVASPTVGSFRRNRSVKGKRQPPMFKEGDVIKEGQLIGYLDQFGTELPVKSDVAGEVVKILFDDGDSVGYGDPLIAVLPSFHGINK